MPRGKDLPQADIDRILELVYNQGRAIKDVSMLLGIKSKAIYSVIHRHKNKDRSTDSPPKRGGQKPNLLTEEHLKFIDQCLAVNCTLTVAALTRLLNERFSTNVSVSTIRRTMKKMGFTLKLIKNIPFSRNTEETIESRFEYAMWISGITPRLVYSNLIFMDEAGFNTGLRRNNGYNYRGFPAVQVSLPNRSPNMSIIGAMNGSKGMIHFSCSFSKTNDQAIVAFIKCLQQKIIQDPREIGVDPENTIFIVCDNASIHKTRNVQNECFSNGQSSGFKPSV